MIKGKKPVYTKGNETVKTWATIAKRMTCGKTIEKLERVESGDIRKEVEERSCEEKRKRRLIVFNLRQSEIKMAESLYGI